MNNNEFPCFLAGIVGGAMILVSTLAWLQVTPEKIADMNMSPSDFATMISGFGGAVLGAVIGGVISWLVARQTAIAAERARKSDLNAETKTSLIKVFLKLKRMSDELLAFKMHMQRGLETINPRGREHINLWLYIDPTKGPWVYESFEPGDLTQLAHLNEITLLMRSANLATEYRTCVRSMENYSEKRAALQSKYEGFINAADDGVPFVANHHMVDVVTRRQEKELNRVLLDLLEYVELLHPVAWRLEQDFVRFATTALEAKGGFINVDYSPEPGENPA